MAGRSFPTIVFAETLAATAASTLALALLARAQGRGGLQLLNATSHWLNGEVAARERRSRWRTTGVGLATQAAATGSWGIVYEAWLRGGRRRPVDVLGKAAGMAGVSALANYRATPKRFTPGWEFVLGPGAMALAYALATGLAEGAGHRRGDVR